MHIKRAAVYGVGSILCLDYAVRGKNLGFFNDICLLVGLVYLSIAVYGLRKWAMGFNTAEEL